jgi:adenosylcobinamide kinase/adenosylcobinamide-phosphate guanylyltransferase
MSAWSIARSELILGGQKSGKSRRAELLARHWIAHAPGNRATLLATGQAWDEEMRVRIARHQEDRARRVPGLITVEEPYHLAETIWEHEGDETLLVIDCLTLWLTNRMMPAQGRGDSPEVLADAIKDLALAIEDAASPIVLVGNEIGLGVIPLGSEVRAFVDTLGRLNQAVAASCRRVTLMAAGLPLTLKDET